MKWLPRVWKHLRLALRYGWWTIAGSPEQRRDMWRRHSRDHMSLETVRYVEEREARRCAELAALPFERPMVKDKRRAGWWSR